MRSFEIARGNCFRLVSLGLRSFTQVDDRGGTRPAKFRFMISPVLVGLGTRATTPREVCDEAAAYVAQDSGPT